MPKVAEGVYAQYFDAVFGLATRDGGVSRPEIMEKTGVSRILADGIIDRLKLKRIRTEGRAEFFGPGKGTEKVAKEAGVSAEGSTTTKPESAEATVAALVTPGPATASVAEEPKKGGRRKKNEPESNGNGSGTVDLQGEIKKTRAAISEALNTAKDAEQMRIEQTALAQSLQSTLARLLERATS